MVGLQTLRRRTAPRPHPTRVFPAWGLRLKGKGVGGIGFRELLNLGAEGAGDGSRLDLRTKLEGLGLKTMRHGLAGCGKDGARGDPNARPRLPGVCVGSGLHGSSRWRSESRLRDSFTF